jgi:anti-sigma28 factor (negative regulator of flagellin synthesis)
MKILRPNSSSGLFAVGASGSGSFAKLPEAHAASDQAQLSSLSSYLASALNGSVSQVAKVNQLSADVSRGRYQVDAYAVGGSIIQHSIEFGGTGYLGLST